MYADIKEIAWPREVTADNVQLQEDGSVCVTSKDEFGSLILSPHRRDFTICYLSALSAEKKRERKLKCSKNETDSAMNLDAINNTEKHSHFSGHNPTTDQMMNKNNRCRTPVIGEDNLAQESLNLSPITQASCADSPPALSNASGSPVTPENTQKDRHAKYRQYSTPTEGLEDGTQSVCPKCLKRISNNAVSLQKQTVGNPEGSFLGENHGGQNNEQNCCQCLQQTDEKTQRVVDTGQVLLKDKGINNYRPLNENLDLSKNSDGSSETDQGEVRRNYTWLTRHISCDECPTNWSHVIKMAQTFAENDHKQSAECQGKAI